MTTELEKQFFDTFEIEAKIKDLTPAQILYSDIERLEYPQITDKQYLSLIVVLNNYFNITEGGYPIMLLGLTIEALREHILKRCINYADCNFVKGLVQAIFEGER